MYNSSSAMKENPSPAEYVRIQIIFKHPDSTYNINDEYLRGREL